LLCWFLFVIFRLYRVIELRGLSRRFFFHLSYGFDLYLRFLPVVQDGIALFQQRHARRVRLGDTLLLRD
jgi:hypothetical protein